MAVHPNPCRSAVACQASLVDQSTLEAAPGGVSTASMSSQAGASRHSEGKKKERSINGRYKIDRGRLRIV